MGFKKLKNFILKMTPSKIINLYQEPIRNQYRISDSYSTLSYSQEGEDLILKRIFESQKKGFYVDVGAHHPKRFSNTFLFYKMGWKGINIDATPGSMQEFRKIRPRDTNLEKAISDKKESSKYFIFNEPALNTFSFAEASKKNGLREYKIIEELEIQTFKLSEILNENLQSGQRIDFLNIDVEGFDFKVLKSINWSVHIPSVILIEDLNLDVENLIENKIYKFLRKKSYQLIAKTFNTLIFKKEE